MVCICNEWIEQKERFPHRIEANASACMRTIHCLYFFYIQTNVTNTTSEITCIEQTTCILRIHAEQVYARRAVWNINSSGNSKSCSASQPASGIQFETVNHWNTGTLVHNDTNVAFLHPIRINYSIEERIVKIKNLMYILYECIHRLYMYVYIREREKNSESVDQDNNGDIRRWAISIFLYIHTNLYTETHRVNLERTIAYDFTVLFLSLSLWIFLSMYENAFILPIFTNAHNIVVVVLLLFCSAICCCCCFFILCMFFSPLAYKRSCARSRFSARVHTLSFGLFLYTSSAVFGLCVEFHFTSM